MCRNRSLLQRVLGLGVVLGLLVLVAGCGSAPAGNAPPGHHPTTVSSPTRLATATPSIARVSYPWAMTPHTNVFNGQTFWTPSNPAVNQEMMADFLSYWSWSGYGGPTAFPFTPNAHQIPLLATTDYSGQLQGYASQIASSGQVTAYVGAIDPAKGRPAQTVRCTDQSGLVCNNGYAFNTTTKTVYNSQTGAVSTATAQITVVCQVTQDYNQELHRWQLSAVQLQEVAD